MRILIIMMFIMFAAGCGKKKPDDSAETVQPAPEEKKQPSSVELAVDGFTGKAHIDAMKKSEKKINSIAEEYDKRLQEQVDQE